MAKEILKETSRKPDRVPFSNMSDQESPAGGPEKLAWMIRQNRLKAGMSEAQVFQKTKIHHRILEALEDGDFKKMPSPAHLRAFVLAVTRACDGDEKAILEAWRESGLSFKEVSHQRLPSALPPKGETVPARVEAPEAAPVFNRERAEPSRPGATSLWLKANSAWFVWVGLALGAGLILWMISALTPRHHPGMDEKTEPARVSEASTPSASAPTPVAASGEPVQAAQASPSDNHVPGELYLRARADCWVLLSIDGKVKPVVNMVKSEKRFFKVRKRAVLLAGDGGALKIGWEGNSLGYLGNRGEAMNGVVFEPGKAFVSDHGQDLPVPSSNDIGHARGSEAPAPAPSTLQD